MSKKNVDNLKILTSNKNIPTLKKKKKNQQQHSFHKIHNQVTENPLIKPLKWPLRTQQVNTQLKLTKAKSVRNSTM